MITIPAVDANTMALVTWSSGQFRDLAGKLSWKTTATQSEQTTADAEFGRCYFGDTAFYESTVSLPNNATLECWYYWDGGTYVHCEFCGVSEATSGGHTSFTIGCWKDGRNVEMDLHAVDNGKYPLSVGWNHIAITRTENRKCSIFVNGVLKKEDNNGLNLQNNTFFIARYMDNNSCSVRKTQKIGLVRLSSCVRYTANFSPKEVFGEGGQGPVNFDNVFPYNQIHDVTIDGQAMIWYPKTYVRAIDLPGGKYKGKYAWQICQYPKKGFHVHRAFIDNSGKERDGFYLGKYEASNQNGLPASINGATPWVNITMQDAIAKCKLRNTDANNEEKHGWHIQSCFEYWFVSLLMLIELGNADVYTVIGAGGQGSLQKCGSTNAVWRGLYEHWANTWEIVDGCKTDGNGIVQIWDTTGEHYISTGKKPTDSGIARGFGNGYDLADTFIPADDGQGSKFSSTTSDVVWTGKNTVTYLGGGKNHGSLDGAFAFAGQCSESYSYDDVGFRLAKY